MDSTYNIRLGRAREITGPYFDKHGVDLAQGGGTLLLATDGAFIGRGHAGILEEAGTFWLSCHFYDGAQRGASKLALACPGRDGPQMESKAVSPGRGKQSERGSATVPVALFGVSPNRWGGRFLSPFGVAIGLPRRGANLGTHSAIRRRRIVTAYVMKTRLQPLFHNHRDTHLQTTGDKREKTLAFIAAVLTSTVLAYADCPPQ